MNFKKLAFLGIIMASTTLTTLPMHRLTRLARPVLRRLNIFKPAGLSAARQALPTQARTARLLAGAGVATATAALLTQQPAEAAVVEVTCNVYTTPKGFKHRIIIIFEKKAQAQDIEDKHNAQKNILAAGLQNTISPSYLLIQAETLLEPTAIGSQASNGNKPEITFFDRQDKQDLYLLDLASLSDEELLEKHKISAEQRNSCIEKELAKCAAKNEGLSQKTINKAHFPSQPPFKAYITGCVNEINGSDASINNLHAAAYATAHSTTVAHLLCEVFKKILKKENNTIVVVANRFNAQQLQEALVGVGNSVKVLGHFGDTNLSDHDNYVKEDFGSKAALWIKEHENKFDRKAQK